MKYYKTIPVPMWIYEANYESCIEYNLEKHIIKEYPKLGINYLKRYSTAHKEITKKEFNELLSKHWPVKYGKKTIKARIIDAW